MAVWALSGVVMMYVSFPETGEAERHAGLEPIAPWQCCGDTGIAADEEVMSASVEMLEGAPVLRWRGQNGGGIVSLADGGQPPLGPQMASVVAATHMQHASGQSLDPLVERITLDQWTVYGQYRRHQPLWKASFDDDAGTVLYVSGADGTVVQDTTTHERFWNWLGAVPHWLYFTQFRQNQKLWYDTVVYASLLGAFLTLTGLYIGVLQFRRGKRLSPYRGLALWHHWTGLVFGVLTLTWVVSGLFSMQPWGMFESEGPGEELAAMAGRPADAGDVARFAAALAARPADDAVSARLSVQEGEAWAVLAHADGRRTRISLDDRSERPMSTNDLERRARIARPGDRIMSMEMIDAPDAYYYAHKSALTLPVFRAIYDDAEKTRLYIDPATGELVAHVDSVRRSYRWWFNGLHRMDFVHWLRARPVWDIVTLPLMLGVSLLTLIGLVLGVKRLGRTLKRKA